MQANEVFWHYFQQTGNIGSYLLSKQLEGDGQWYDEVFEEEESASLE